MMLAVAMRTAHNANLLVATHGTGCTLVSTGVLRSCALVVKMSIKNIRVIHNELVTEGGAETWVEVWSVPPDFDSAEVRLLEEFATNGVLTPREAYDAIRELRK